MCQLVGGLEYVARQGGPRFLSRGECFSFAQVRWSRNATGTPGAGLLLCSSVRRRVAEPEGSQDPRLLVLPGLGGSSQARKKGGRWKDRPGRTRMW